MKHLHNSKLLQSLRSLTAAELAQFGQYVATPFFNTRPQSEKMLAFLTGFAPDFDQAGLNEQALFEAIFGHDPYDHQGLKTEFSHLFRLLRGFLAQLELRQREDELALLTLAQLRKRKVDKVFLSQKNALEKRISLLPTESRLKLRFLLQEEIERFHGQQQRRLDETGIEEKMESLDAFYFYHKLRAGCEMLNRQNILAKNTALPLLAEVQQLAGEMQAETAITLYRQIYSCLAEPTVLPHYHQLRESLARHQTALPKEEARAMYKYAQNYCIARINKGESDFFGEIFNLYKAQLESDIILSEGILNHTDYANIVTTALRLREYGWAKDFIEDFCKKLLPHHQDDMYRYNLANWHFEQQDFGPAMRLLQQIEMDDPFYEASSKVLLCKVYFESQEWESLRYLIEAFKRYLQRSKAFSQKHRTHYLHFLRHLKAISSLYERRPYLLPADFAARLNKIADRLQADESVSNKRWLESMC